MNGPGLYRNQRRIRRFVPYQVPYQFRSTRPRRQRQLSLDQRLNQLELNTASNNFMSNRIGLGVGNVNLGPMRRIRRNMRTSRRIRLRRQQVPVIRRPFANREFEVTQRESYKDIVAGMNRFDFTPGQTGMPFLDGLSQLFDNYKIIALTFEISSGTATTKDGKFHSGIDYQSGDKDMTLAELKSLFKYQSDNVFKTQTQVADPMKAMKQRLHATATHNRADSGVPTNACTLYVYCDSDGDNIVKGEVFVQYTIQLVSPNPPPSAGRGPPVTAQTTSTFVPNVASNPQIQPASSFAINEDDQRSMTIVHANDNIANIGVDGTVDSVQITGLKQNDTFTMATTAPATGFTADQIKVNFSYSDGTPVEVGAIKPLATPVASGLNVVGLHELHQARVGDVIDILASIFQLVKPLVKDLPIIGSILKIVSPENLSTFALPDDVEIPVSTSAFGFGDDLNITIPDTNENDLGALNMNTVELIVKTVTGEDAGSYIAKAVDNDGFNDYSLSVYLDSAIVPVDTNGTAAGLPFPATFTKLYVSINSSTTPITEGDVFTLALTNINKDNGPSNARNLYQYDIDTASLVGFANITTGGAIFLVATAVEENVTRQIVFAVNTNGYNNFLPDTDPNTPSNYVIRKTTNFSMVRIGSALRSTFDVPMQDASFELDVRSSKQKRRSILV